MLIAVQILGSVLNLQLLDHAMETVIWALSIKQFVACYKFQMHACYIVLHKSHFGSQFHLYHVCCNRPKTIQACLVSIFSGSGIIQSKEEKLLIAFEI